MCSLFYLIPCPAKVNKQPDTLFLVVQDECHWGIKAKGVLDTVFINRDDTINAQNLFFLQVSATAYNTIAVEGIDISKNVILWNTVMKVSSDVC